MGSEVKIRQLVIKKLWKLLIISYPGYGEGQVIAIDICFPEFKEKSIRFPYLNGIPDELSNYISNYKGRTDLVELYGDNSLLLYALQLRCDIEDIISVASEALMDRR